MLVFLPFTHVVETEMLVDADSVAPFIVKVARNPFQQESKVMHGS